MYICMYRWIPFFPMCKPLFAYTHSFLLQTICCSRHLFLEIVSSEIILDAQLLISVMCQPNPLEPIKIYTMGRSGKLISIISVFTSWTVFKVQMELVNWGITALCSGRELYYGFVPGPISGHILYGIFWIGNIKHCSAEADPLVQKHGWHIYGLAPWGIWTTQMPAATK